MEKLSCPNINFGPLHWQGDSLAYSLLITVLYLIWCKDHWEPWKEVGSQNLAKYIIRVRNKNLLIQSWCSGLWWRCWIPNDWVSSSKPLVRSKVDSVFHPSTINGMSTFFFFENIDYNVQGNILRLTKINQNNIIKMPQTINITLQPMQ